MSQAMQLETQLKAAQGDYQTKLSTIETELQKYMLSKQQESQNLLLQADQRLKQEEDEKKTLQAKVDSLKHSNAEMAKELIEVTNLQSQGMLEIKNLNAELRKGQLRVSEAEESLRSRDKDTAEFREQQIQVLHEQKAEFAKVAEQLKSQVQSARMERDSLEVRLKQLLMENQSHLEVISKQENGA